MVAATITDGTQDPERAVTANLRVSIQDRPSAPGVPALVDGTLTARSVQVAWAPADANGAPVDAYTVTGSGVAAGLPRLRDLLRHHRSHPGPAVRLRGHRPQRGRGSVRRRRRTDRAGRGANRAGAAAATNTSGGTAVGQLDGTGRRVHPGHRVRVQILRGDSVVEIRDNVSSPVVWTALTPPRLPLPGAGQQPGGRRTWSEPSAPLVPSGVPAAPSGLTAAFVYDDYRRQVDVTWAPPPDTGGEPIQGYRLLLNNAEFASGDAGFTSKSVPVAGDEPLTFSVIARNTGARARPPTG